jgi:hypothetical protein
LEPPVLKMFVISSKFVSTAPIWLNYGINSACE